MPIFRLEKTDGDLSKAELIVAQETNLQLEQHLESWLENSPGALIPDEIVLWIARQTSARTEEHVVFPDLLGVDADGNLIVAELKRDKTPRETVAQLLEYAAWANELTEEQIHAHAEEYLERPFQDAFREAFDIPDAEEIPPLNSAMRLFIAAGEIPPSVAAVCRFLRTAYGMDVSCLSVSTFQTEAGEMLVSIESTVGNEPPAPSKTQKRSASPIERWSGDKLARDVILEAARELTGEDTEKEFTPSELLKFIRNEYPNFKTGTLHGQIAAGCPNSPSHAIHPVKNKYYWRVKRGTFRLYDPDRDGADEAAAS